MTRSLLPSLLAGGLSLLLVCGLLWPLPMALGQTWPDTAFHAGHAWGVHHIAELVAGQRSWALNSELMVAPEGAELRLLAEHMNADPEPGGILYLPVQMPKSEIQRAMLLGALTERPLSVSASTEQETLSARALELQAGLQAGTVGEEELREAGFRYLLTGPPLQRGFRGVGERPMKGFSAWVLP